MEAAVDHSVLAEVPSVEAGLVPLDIACIQLNLKPTAGTDLSLPHLSLLLLPSFRQHTVLALGSSTRALVPLLLLPRRSLVDRRLVFLMDIWVLVLVHNVRYIC